MEAEAFADPERPETADQNADRELQRVLRHARQRPAERQGGERHRDGGPDGSQARRDDHVAGGSNREDDEDDLEALEDHSLERGDERDGIPPGRCRFGGAGQRRGRALERSALVVERDDPGPPQHRLPQPAQPEQQEEKADDQLEDGERNDRERRAETDDEGGEDREPAGRSQERPAPSAHRAHREDDGHRLDALDERSQKRRGHRGAGMNPVDHRASSLFDGSLLFVHSPRYPPGYNAANSLSSHGDASDELAGLRSESVSGVRRAVPRGQRDARGETARHESAGTEPRPEPLAVSAEGSAVHPHPRRHGADAARRAAGASAPPRPRADGAGARARDVRGGADEPAV